MNTKRITTTTLASIAITVGTLWSAEFSWQQPQAEIDPKGNLSWAPREFEFTAGETVRYIDFENGDDTHEGVSKESPWKHHPWDSNATGRAAEASGVATYVFKGGVTYRGFLQADDSGTEDEPIRLTRDPSWGEGDAIISGAETIEAQWQAATQEDVPDGMPAKSVWFVDLGKDAIEPWAVWQVGADGEATRIHIARDPNWTLSNRADPKAEWAEWTSPSRQHERRIGARDAADEALKGKPKDFFEGVYCWSEWGGGIWGAMSLPYRSPVTNYNPETGAIDRVVISPLFDGWAVAGDRYFMEKHPSYLDHPGEYYFAAPTRAWPTGAKQGFPWEYKWLPTDTKTPGRLFIRLPEDANPNDERVEIAVRTQGLRIFDQNHIEVSGLTFSRFNVPYRPQNPNLPGWEAYDHLTQLDLETFAEPSAIMLGGNTSNIRVANNRFYHVPAVVKGTPWRAPNIAANQVFPNLSGGAFDSFGEFEISDNDIENVDHEGINLRGRTLRGVTLPGTPTLGRVSIMRNRLHHISQRPERSKNSPAIFIGGGNTLAEIAGNEMIDCFGMGIYTSGGKSGGDERTIPLIRFLIYNNRADYVMTSANDWGQIAHWQGGPGYIFNNAASNAPGYRNHEFRDWDKEGKLPTYIANAMPYYGDGTYKSYWFNNLAWSDYNAKTSKYRTQAAFHFVLGFQNYIFNNSTWNTNTGAKGSVGNRGGFLGNIFAHTNSNMINSKSSGNISVAGGGEAAVALNAGTITTVAYTQNLLADTLGVSEPVEIGVAKRQRSQSLSLEEFNPIVADVGVLVEQEPYRDIDQRDFRPVKDVTDAVSGVRLFVPWGLYATVGEWQFRHNANVDPRIIFGEHFYMTDEYVQRDMYYEVPRGDLIAPHASAGSFVPGPLTNWVENGAMQFNGEDAFAMLSHERLTESYEISSGFYDKNTEDGTVVRASGKPLKPLLEKLADSEEQLANKGIKDPEKLRANLDKQRSRYESLQKAIEERQSKVQEMEKELAEADIAESRAKQLKNQIKKEQEWIAQKEPRRDSLLEALKEDEAKLENGDPEAVAKLRDEEIPKLKEQIATKRSQGVPDILLYPGEKRQTVNIDTGNLLIEVYLHTQSNHTGGVIAGKMDMDKAGYQLRIDSKGRPEFLLVSGGKKESFAADQPINDGDWHHVIVEIDRASGQGNFYLDGKSAGTFASSLSAEASLANTADFLVGKGTDGDYFAGAMDFLRVCRGTLADAQTSIEELYAWQFTDGPFLKDFTGRMRDWESTPPGAIGY